MDGYLRAEISVSALQHNLNLLRGTLASGVRLCPVIKANAYGHGVRQVLDVMAPYADMLGVAICSEAAALRNMGWRGPIVMFTSAAASDSGTLAELVAQDVTLTVTNLEEIPLLLEAAHLAGRPAQVHIKIDSGMTRSGALPEKALPLIEAARACKLVRLTGLFTHFACAEDRDKSTTREQLARFLAAVDASGPRGGLVLHAANSAATIDLPETHLDMVRPGLAVFGYQPSHTLYNYLPLKPLLRLTAPIVLIKDAPAGAATGYGLTYRFQRDARVAVVPVGYADGYFRSLSNLAVMRVHGVNCPVRGRVSMDQTVIEITDVPRAVVGDTVEIISPDPTAPNSVEQLARLAGTIPYEVITRLGDRITRVALGSLESEYVPATRADAMAPLLTAANPQGKQPTAVAPLSGLRRRLRGPRSRP